MVANFGEGLAVNKQRSHRFHMDRFSLKKLNDVESKEKHHVDGNIFAAMENWELMWIIVVLGKR
jgi:hypothetical protein